MNLYYLNTPDEATMRGALIEAGAATEQEGALIPAAGITLDVIGPWYERTGGTDEEPVYTALPGWHFNVYSNALINWPESVTVTEPATPWRVLG